MIVKELNKPTTYPITSVGNPPPRVQLPTAPVTFRRGLPLWTKLTYSRWIEGVKEKYKVGNLVCWKDAPAYTDSTKPPFYYEVVGIQELFHYVEINTKGIPLALCVRVAEASKATPHWRAPDDMRHLTQEEINLVNLRAKEKQDALQPSAICLTTDG